MPNIIQEEQKPAITAASIAQDLFKKELEIHSTGSLPAETVVIIHDSCYGHRYSRPRTSKSSLSTIVERPERLHASILGISAAYVRLAGRHMEGHTPLRPDLDLKIIPPPPFHIKKTNRVMPLGSPAVTQVHGQKWMEELQMMCELAQSKLATNGKELARPPGHGHEPDGSPSPQLHEGDLYLCKESLNAFEGCLGGVCEGIDTIFGAGPAKRAFVCIRPPGHHCSSNYPSGFCWLNNVHVGIAHAAMTHGLTHAAIIDFDLHHGDGSQSITWNHNRKAATLAKNAAYHRKVPIGYYSLHDINSYPCEMGDEEKVRNASLCIENAHGQSIWNVHLEPWKNLPEFWELYELRYSILLDKAKRFLLNTSNKLRASVNAPRPKAAIFISAGFDACEWEGAGMQRHKVNVPADFYAKFTSDIVSMAEEEGLGVDGRVISVLEGGYSDRALTSGALSHICGLSDAPRFPQPGSNGLLTNGFTGASGNDTNIAHTSQVAQVSSTPYNASWWAEHHLESLESFANPTPKPTAPKKPKDKAPGNYSSPTQASTAKMIDPSKARRYSSLSGVDMARLSAEPETPQPLPEVDWAIASYELSRLLIPSNRQTLSCRHEELNAEINRVKRERQSIGPQQISGAGAEGRMQLRDRRPRPVAAEEDLSRAMSRANRRRTIAAVGELPEPDLPDSTNNSRDGDKSRARSNSRRLSAASSILSGFSNLNLDGRQETGKENSSKTSSAARSSRAPSVLSEKAPKPPLVKKTRPPTTTKSSTSKVSTAKSSPKKSAIGLSVPKDLSTEQGSNENGESAIRKSAEAIGKASVSRATEPNDVDHLSKGLKKMSIKLNVPSPEENAAREKAARVKQSKNITEKPKKSRAPKKAAVPKASKLGTTQVDQSVESTVTQNPEVLPAPVQEPSTQQSSSSNAPASLITPTSSLTHGSKSSEAEFIPSTSEGFPIQAPISSSLTAPAPPIETSRLMSPEVNDEHPTEMIKESDAQRGPPTTDVLAQIGQEVLPRGSFSKPSTPTSLSPPHSTKKTRADLPIFTSTSPIPFGKAPLGANGPNSAVALAVGQNNEKMASTFGAEAARDDLARSAQQPQNQLSTEHRLNEKAAARSDASIWEVPETPRG